jgi:hypothetical protein
MVQEGPRGLSGRRHLPQGSQEQRNRVERAVGADGRRGASVGDETVYLERNVCKPTALPREN